MNRIVWIALVVTFGGLGAVCFSGPWAAETARPNGMSEAASDSIAAKPVGETIELPYRAPEFAPNSFVDRAYAAIPMRRTPFDPTNPSVLPTHREYLHQVSALIDQAVVWRVSGMQALERQGTDIELWPPAGARLLEGLERLKPPVELKRYHGLITQSITALTQFFQLQAVQSASPVLAAQTKNPQLQLASNNARDAYVVLKQLYPNCDAAADAAFYDIQHALDPL